MKYKATVHQEWIIPVWVEASSPDEAVERIHNQECESGDQYPGECCISDLHPVAE